MPPALQAAVVIGAWVLVVLLITLGTWFLRERALLHTAVMVVLGIVGIFLLIRLQELLVMLVIAMIFGFILGRPAKRLSRKLPWPAAVAIVYLAVAGFMAVLGAVVFPRLLEQSQMLVRDLPGHADNFRGYLDGLAAHFHLTSIDVRSNIATVEAQLREHSQEIAKEVERILGEVLKGSFHVGLAFIISIYLLLDRERIREQFIRFFPVETRADVITALEDVSTIFSAYLRGQVTVILFVAFAATIGLMLLGVRYAYLIGVAAGVLEIVPYFGAIVGAVPAVILGFSHSTATGIWVIVLFIAINQLEGHVVIPYVMGRELEMRPLAVLLSLLGGEMLLGVVGMVIAVPTVSMLRVVIPHVVKHYHVFRMRERLRSTTVESPPAEAIITPPRGLT